MFSGSKKYLGVQILEPLQVITARPDWISGVAFLGASVFQLQQAISIIPS